MAERVHPTQLFTTVNTQSPMKWTIGDMLRTWKNAVKIIMMMVISPKWRGERPGWKGERPGLLICSFWGHKGRWKGNPKLVSLIFVSTRRRSISGSRVASFASPIFAGLASLASLTGAGDGFPWG